MTGAVHAQSLTTSRLFNSGMVLQRETPVPVWGTAGTNTQVSVTLNGVQKITTADAGGAWRVQFDAMSAGGPYTMTIVSGDATKTYTDVYIGDVWVCSGQSNMEWSVANSNDAVTNTQGVNNPKIREFKVSKATADSPKNELSSGTWTGATSAENIKNFTAVGYYFANDIQPKIGDVPVGLLNVSYGGARIEAFMSEEMLGYGFNDITLAAGEAERQPNRIFNAMIHPITQFPVKGFLWYQGESNADNNADALNYGQQFRTMIESWRKLWGLGDLPFVWVQLTNFNPAANENSPTALNSEWNTWAILRDAQSRALVLPNTAEAVIIDLGDANDIHPTNKKPVGERVSLAVQRLAYDKEVVSDGPRYKSHAIDGNKVTLTFETLGSPIAEESLKWFTVAGSDNVLHKATATVTGANTVEVSHASVTNPKIVRYAWEHNPAGVNFYNTAGLTASPFSVELENKGFGINSFAMSPSKTEIERGQFITLSWKTSGADIVTINDATVDISGSWKLMPLGDNAEYVLKIVDRENPKNIDTQTITLNIINPKPTITLAMKPTNVIAPNETATIEATAKAPGGGTVKKVEFYINGKLHKTLTAPPYNLQWIPAKTGAYVITAKVTNSLGDFTTSLPTHVTVTKLSKTRYEAENATLTSSGSIESLALASGGKYYNLTSNDFKLIFNNVHAETDGSYQMNIRYLLNHGGPKGQDLYINNVLIKKDLMFEAPDTLTWMDLTRMVDLKAGNNTIEFRGSWGWMSFDYIEIIGASK